jgi:allantoinase
LGSSHPQWQCVTRDGVRAIDVAVEGERIVELASASVARRGRRSMPLGCTSSPGLIDPHVHFNEPGRTDWEGWATGSAALAAGGGTCCFEMPLNANPPTLDGPSFDLKRAAAEASSHVDFGLWGGLTPDNLGRLEELAERGVVGFKAFMSGSGIAEFGRADDVTLHTGMRIAQSWACPLRCMRRVRRSRRSSRQRHVPPGRRDAQAYLDSRPAIGEVDAIAGRSSSRRTPVAPPRCPHQYGLGQHGSRRGAPPLAAQPKRHGAAQRER